MRFGVVCVLVVSIANCFGGTTPLDESLYACVLGCMGNQGMMWEVIMIQCNESTSSHVNLNVSYVTMVTSQAKQMAFIL